MEIPSPPEEKRRALRDTLQRRLSHFSPPPPPPRVRSRKCKEVHHRWKGIKFSLPSVVQLASSPNDDLFHLRGPLEHLQAAGTLLTRQLGGTLLWGLRHQRHGEFKVSGSSAMIRWSADDKVLIADCFLAQHDDVFRKWLEAQEKNQIVPLDLHVLVAFEFVSGTDDVLDTWQKCSQYVATRRAAMAVEICDRRHQHEVLALSINNMEMVRSFMANKVDPHFPGKYCIKSLAASHVKACQRRTSLKPTLPLTARMNLIRLLEMNLSSYRFFRMVVFCFMKGAKPLPNLHPLNKIHGYVP